MFQIPPALGGIKPTSWKGILYGRNGESNSRLAEFQKDEFLRRAARRDLSRELLPLEHESDCGDHFVGRQALLTAAHHFIDTKDRGLLLIKGPPGLGKSALVAELRRQLTAPDKPKPIDFCYHRHLRSVDHCLRHLCASLLIQHDLATPETARLQPGSEALFDQFRRILVDVAGRLSGPGRQVLLIDALRVVPVTIVSRD